MLEGFLGFSPSATGPWAEVLDPMPKYIASRTLSGDLDWNAHVIEGDAVDELNLWIHPAIGGAGTRPFEGTTLSLELLDVTAYESGVVLQRYRSQA